MDRLLTMEKDQFVSRMQEEVRRLLEGVADAVNSAPTGNVINGSEMQVRDLMGEFRRMHAGRLPPLLGMVRFVDDPDRLRLCVVAGDDTLNSVAEAIVVPLRERQKRVPSANRIFNPLGVVVTMPA